MPKVRKPKIGGGGGSYQDVRVKGSPFTLGQMEQAGMYRPLGAPEPSAGGDGGSTFTNTAERDPRLDKHLDRLDRRMDDPEGSTRRAIDRAGSAIRDATEGRRSALGGMMARRGVLGSTSIPGLSEGALMDEEGRAVNKAAADISLGRERDNDAFMLGATGAYGEAARLNLSERELGLRQHLGTRGLDLQAAQFAHAQERGQLQDLLSILQGL